VSRYLHDGTAQALTNLVLKAEICEHMVDRDTAEAKAELQALRASLTAGLQETRRLIFQLRPMTLDDIGLVPTLRRYLGEVGRAGRFSHTVRGPETNDTFAPHIRSLLFRLIQEVVAGLVGRGALEQVTVDLNAQDSRLELTIEARSAVDAPPPEMESVVTEEPVAQRLLMLGATTEIVAIGERGTQMVISALPPAA
jgi:two-component system sensor histidine kinase DegS